MSKSNFNIVYTILMYAAVSIGTLAFPLLDQNQSYEVPNDTSKCVNDLIAWCDGMKYPQDGAGVAMLSVTIVEPDGYYRTFCASDFNGTNCTRNGKPWFSCSQDNKFFYKEQPLSKDSTVNTDNTTCKTADKAFNDLYVQNLSYNSTTIKNVLEKGMESFFRQMMEMQEEIRNLRTQMTQMFGNGFPFGHRYYPTHNVPDDDDDDDDSTETELERE